MAKLYKDRAMTAATDSEVLSFFFPSHVPPISITAHTLEEAETILQKLDNPKEI